MGTRDLQPARAWSHRRHSPQAGRLLPATSCLGASRHGTDLPRWAGNAGQVSWPRAGLPERQGCQTWRRSNPSLPLGHEKSDGSDLAQQARSEINDSVERELSCRYGAEEPRIASEFCQCDTGAALKDGIAWLACSRVFEWESR